jgi:hypothetical protein
MVNLPFLIVYRQKIKKEDVRKYINWDRKDLAFRLIFIQIVIVIWQLNAHPIVLKVYYLSRIYPPVVVMYSLYIAFALAIFAMLVALYFLFTKPDYKRVDAIASKYKAGEMIKASEIRDNKYNWLMMTIMLVTFSVFD